MEEFEEFNEPQDMKDLFESILGAKINIKDDIENTEEKVFCILVDKLEEQIQIEMEVYKISGLELVQATQNLWFVVESQLKILYGEAAGEATMWYILYRRKEGGDDLIFDDGKDGVKINTIKRLWKYVKSQLNE
jgi:hypothetical protein